MTESHPFRHAMKGAQTSGDRLFECSLCGFGITGQFESMPKRLTGSAVDHRREDAQTIVTWETVSKVSGPAFVGVSVMNSDLCRAVQRLMALAFLRASA